MIDLIVIELCAMDPFKGFVQALCIFLCPITFHRASRRIVEIFLRGILRPDTRPLGKHI
jgi:hypothetical protein